MNIVNFENVSFSAKFSVTENCSVTRRGINYDKGSSCVLLVGQMVGDISKGRRARQSRKKYCVALNILNNPRFLL